MRADGWGDWADIGSKVYHLMLGLDIDKASVKPKEYAAFTGRPPGDPRLRSNSLGEYQVSSKKSAASRKAPPAQRRSAHPRAKCGEEDREGREERRAGPAAEAYKAAVPEIDTMVSKGIIHRNKAARHKSRLNKALKAIKAR